MPKQTKPLAQKPSVSTAIAQAKEQKTKEVLLLHDALPLRRGSIYTLPADLAASAIKAKLAVSPNEQHRTIAGKAPTTPITADMVALQDQIAARSSEKL